MQLSKQLASAVGFSVSQRSKGAKEFVHKATTSDSMIIALHWESGSPPIHPIYIFVSKDKVVASRNLLINEPSLKSYNIPSYYQGKQLYLWITIQADLIVINFSGTRAITVTHRIIQFNRDTNLRREV